MKLPDAVPWACDVCGKPRNSDVNHWWVLTIEAALVESPEIIPELHIVPYTDDFAKRLEAAHACGQAHAQILVARFMAHGSFEKLPQEADDASGT